MDASIVSVLSDSAAWRDRIRAMDVSGVRIRALPLSGFRPSDQDDAILVLLSPRPELNAEFWSRFELLPKTARRPYRFFVVADQLAPADARRARKENLTINRQPNTDSDMKACILGDLRIAKTFRQYSA